MDYTALTGAVDFTTALAALAVVSAALATYHIGAKGARLVLDFIAYKQSDYESRDTTHDGYSYEDYEKELEKRRK